MYWLGTLVLDSYLPKKVDFDAIRNDINDLAYGSVVSISLASGDYTLSTADYNKQVLVVSVAHATNALILPATVGYKYQIINADVSTALLVKKPSGTPIIIPASDNAIVTYNGSQYVFISHGSKTTQTLENKTLNTPIISALYKDSAKTKLITIPDVPSDTFAVLTAQQTFTNKVYDSPILYNWNGWVSAENETWSIYTENKSDSDINTSTDGIVTLVDVCTGTPVMFTVNSPTGISVNTVYYAIRVDSTHIKFASSISNAWNSTNVDITNIGSGTRTLNILNRIYIAGDVSSKYQKGYPVRIIQDGQTRYFNIYSVTYVNPNTIIQFWNNADYQLTNTSITHPFYSFVDFPAGFPQFFNWSAINFGFSSVPSSGIYTYRISGAKASAMIRQPNNGTSNATSFYISAPMPSYSASLNYSCQGVCSITDNGTIAFGTWWISPYAAETRFTFGSNASSFTWTASGSKRVVSAGDIWYVY